MDNKWIDEVSVGDEVHFIVGVFSRRPVNMIVTRVTPKRLQTKDVRDSPYAKTRTFIKETGMEYGSSVLQHSESYLRKGHHKEDQE